MRRSLRTVLVLLLAACSSGGESTESIPSTDAAIPSAAPPPAPTPAVEERSAALIIREVAPEPAAPQQANADASSRTAAGGAGSATAPGVGGSLAGAMLIRTGVASVEVRDVDRAVAALRRLVAGVGGQVANTSMQAGREQPRAATLELRIPAQQFDQAVAGLTPLGRVESVNVNAQDVGEEYVDVEARVANARRLEERLVSLLATRTGRLEDVLAVERELARVREEIERHEGRLRYLRTRVAVSTLTVTLHEPQPVFGRTDSPMANAFRRSWENFVGFVASFIAALGTLVPLALVLAAAYLVLRRFLWRVRRREARHEPDHGPLRGPPRDD